MPRFGALFTAHDLAAAIELSVGYRHVEDWNQWRRLPNEERLRQMVAGAAGRRASAAGCASSSASTAAAMRSASACGPRLGFETPMNDHGLQAVRDLRSISLNLNEHRLGRSVAAMSGCATPSALSIPLGGQLRGEIGYLNQYRFGRDGRRDQMDHVADLHPDASTSRSLGDSGD